MLFILGGLVVMNSYAIGPKPISDAEGLAAVGPYRAFAQIFLTTMICLTLAAITGWIAFGPGAREFSTSFIRAPAEAMDGEDARCSALARS